MSLPLLNKYMLFGKVSIWVNSGKNGTSVGMEPILLLLSIKWLLWEDMGPFSQESRVLKNVGVIIIYKIPRSLVFVQLLTRFSYSSYKSDP